MLLINCSNREKNCYKVLNDIKSTKDELISLSNKNMNFCLGCDKCKNNMENYCIQDDYITKEVYKRIIKEEKIILASPLYMSNINAILKNLIDRLYPFYNHQLLKNKKIYLIITGQATKEDNEEEIESIIKYFNGISEWLYFDFEFLDYFNEYNNPNYNNKIEDIKLRLNNK